MSEFALPESDWPARLAPAQRAVLRGALAGLRRTPGLIGVAAGGSFISGRMDEFSDLDLVLVVDASAGLDSRGRKQALAASLGTLVAAFTGEHVGEPRLLICLYGPPLVHVDLKFVTTAELASRVEDPIVLWDRAGALRAALAAGSPRYPAPDPQWIEDRFWVWVHYVAGKIGRGELFDVLDALGFLRARVLGPLALEEAAAQPNGVRRIEHAAATRARELEATVATYDRRDGLRALFAAIALYRSLRDGRARDAVQLNSPAELAALDYLAEVGRRLASERSPRAFEFELSSRLSAPANEVWAHASRIGGVNRELAPLARMTAPRECAALDLSRAPLGRRAFRSWILALGFLPIDYDDLTLVELEPGRRFLERSRMLSQREWEHERVVEPRGLGCVVSDRVRFTPRVALLGPLFLPVFRLAFRVRHRNLRRIFGASAMGD